MKKYYLYAHDGSGNHGCEALVRSTAKLLNVGPDRLTLMSARPEEDMRYGIDQLCRVVKAGTTAKGSKLCRGFIKSYWDLKVKKDHMPMELMGELWGSGAKSGDIAISIGGDVYCYDVIPELVRMHDIWKLGGLKTVYWGCSIEPELLEKPQIADDIRRFDLITARETISYEALKKVNPNTVLVSDSAFLLDKVMPALPPEFVVGNTVGINVSPLIMRYGTAGKLIMKNYEELIRFILETTDMAVCLIPHVIWDDNDDRIPIQELYRQFAGTGRVCVFEDHNAMELKGCISRCSFFVGARTHATIAAYSTGVPTLVVGYSVKSRGIARDLFGTEENYVLSVQNLKKPRDLAEAFFWMQEREKDIRSHLQATIPGYTQRVYDGVKALKKL